MFTNIYGLVTCTDKDKNCIYQVFGKMGNNLKESCKQSCPLECNTVSYSNTITSSSYPTEFFATKLIDKYNLKSRFNSTENITYEKLRDNIVALSFYANSFEFMEINEVESVTILGLISTCGGIHFIFLIFL